MEAGRVCKIQHEAIIEDQASLVENYSTNITKVYSSGTVSRRQCLPVWREHYVGDDTHMLGESRQAHAIFLPQLDDPVDRPSGDVTPIW